MIIDIIRSNFKIILFGFVFTFFSSVGQSFFIGLFNSNIREELNISHGEFGTLYGTYKLWPKNKKLESMLLEKFSRVEFEKDLMGGAIMVAAYK